MTPFYSDDWLTILEGDCRDVLPSLPADSVDCVVTSPPYWGLRDYGHTGQLGLERTPEEYVANMVAVFAEVRRVLKPSGTCWLNLGDSYGSNQSDRDRASGYSPKQVTNAGKLGGKQSVPLGLKVKDLVGIPWRVAFALQADGWYLRSEIIWSKPNPMPESVTDRPTKSHEQLFLLTKSPRYYFDSDAVREGLSGMREDAASSGVLPASEPEQPVVTMPRVQRPASAGMAQASWLDGQDEAGESSVRGNGSGPGDEAEARPLRGETSGDSRLPGERFRAGSESSMDGLTEGPSPMGSVLPRSTDGDDRTLDVDGRGVEDDPDGAGEPLPVLRPAGDPDDGSRHPGEQGRSAHEGERGGSLQALQQPKARSPHMAATPRNDGDRWREVDGGVAARGAGRNLRSVWNIATRPYPGAHFAVFPPELPERCIKAGSSERGVCPECGAPWERVVERVGGAKAVTLNPSRVALGHESIPRPRSSHQPGWRRLTAEVATATGWRPTCGGAFAPLPQQRPGGAEEEIASGSNDKRSCALHPVPAVILDPFAGSGTVGMVANRLSRRAILIDLNPEYLRQQMTRNAQTPLGLGAA